MIIKITAVFPPPRGSSLFDRPRTESVLRHISDSPLERRRGFMEAMNWAQGRFPGAKSISYTTLKVEVKA